MKYTGSGKVNWWRPCGKQFLKKTKKELPYDPEIPFLDISEKKKERKKTLTWKYTCIPLFIAALFTKAKFESNLRVHQQNNKEDITHIYTHSDTHIYTYIVKNYQPKERWNLAIWKKMDKLVGFYTNWNKSDSERQILYDITYSWNLKNKTNHEYNKKETDSQIQRTN